MATVIPLLLVLLVAALAEELVFRGYPLLKLSRLLGKPGSVCLWAPQCRARVSGVERDIFYTWSATGCVGPAFWVERGINGRRCPGERCQV